jgi:thioredoxin reductase (NADPH)
LRKLAGSGDIEMVVPYQLHGLEGDAGRGLTGVVVRDLNGSTRVLSADALLPFFGLAQNLGPIASWGLNMERNLIAIDPATCMTNLPAVCAIGDIASYAGKLKLILTGFAEAAAAAHALFNFVYPGDALHFEYSTTKGIPESEGQKTTI